MAPDPGVVSEPEWFDSRDLDSVDHAAGELHGQAMSALNNWQGAHGTAILPQEWLSIAQVYATAHLAMEVRGLRLALEPQAPPPPRTYVPNADDYDGVTP